MASIKAVVATKPQSFAAGTEQVDFLFMLVDSNANTVATVSSPTPDATFDNVAPGVYSVKCLRFGYVVESGSISVPDTSVTFDIPDTITVTLG